ncbi:hypothetical protein GCM10007868_00840 [Gluconobacter frateurii]|uniref:Uncharacterized protein n=1 Tax=Gluconobacter frateurii NRIC 0228 TaxID=1307946 RepID=A0ABQ0QAS2_9PROT|nr:hypothetical protein AA0228_1278 [Gluconobacter frateurii NRIC 0228]GLP89009.1 hypothetical protein GCM10007868_00840 [Gluconobacter frateurii]
MTTLAGSKTCFDAFPNGLVERAMLTLGLSRGARQAAENACGRDANKSLSIETLVPGQEGCIERFGVWKIEEHPETLEP